MKNKFKVGERVRVTKSKQVFQNSPVGWSDRMTEYLGTEIVIEELGKSLTLGDYYEYNGWSFPVEALTLVKEPVNKTKAHPRCNRCSGNPCHVRFPLTTKLRAVVLRATGMTIYAIAEKLDTSTTSVNYWLRQEKAGQFNEPIAFQRTCEVKRG